MTVVSRSGLSIDGTLMGFSDIFDFCRRYYAFCFLSFVQKVARIS